MSIIINIHFKPLWNHMQVETAKRAEKEWNTIGPNLIIRHPGSRIGFKITIKAWVQQRRHSRKGHERNAKCRKFSFNWPQALSLDKQPLMDLDWCRPKNTQNQGSYPLCCDTLWVLFTLFFIRYRISIKANIKNLPIKNNQTDEKL